MLTTSPIAPPMMRRGSDRSRSRRAVLARAPGLLEDEGREQALREGEDRDGEEAARRGEAEVRQDRRGDEQAGRRRAEEDRGTDQEADHRPAPPRATSIVMGS